MAYVEAGQASVTVPNDQLLRSEAQWRLDPDEGIVPEVLDLPTRFPEPSELDQDAVDAIDLSDELFMKYARLCSQFDKKRALVAATQKALARINSCIIARVAKEYPSQLTSCKTPRQKLVQLAILFKPKGSTRHQGLRNEWRRKINTPIGRTSLETWLTNWANLYDEAKAAKVPDVCYTDGEYPPDAEPIRDLLQAIQPQDSYFVNNWRKDLDQKQPMTFHEVISAYRDYRKVQEQAKEGSNASSVALTAAIEWTVDQSVD
ncbi:hypothetical protein CNMCM5793_004542 [Aspergillus hiratsukae]|uniref:Uncharacterized protein n=1 Tax=Aspergillus hiratsukae TaxID=1194566 RepID=A0A8H6PF72_9EURO|nr:hypothetical protein CNMCM5793_004542 [Aspergillus hiratsukae]KAF7172194.1 hypothetical protein CNMCM6106_006456 [Aspergillus hiratsukae]